MAFASNVGKARILRHDAVEIRLRWVGAILLLLVVAVAAFLTVRYYGLRAGWWPTLLPIGSSQRPARSLGTRSSRSWPHVDCLAQPLSR